MSDHRTHADRRLADSPRLERLLASARGRLRRQVWIHGLGTVLGTGLLWLVFAYLADWGLRVPHAIRLFHSVVFVGVVGFFGWRDLVRPLRRIPDRTGLALLFERVHPELRELLVSAVQLQDGDELADPVLVRRVVEAADRRAEELRPDEVVDPRRPRRRFGLGMGGLALGGLFASLSPGHARIFLDHLAGGSTPWPQRTYLTLELPGLDGATEVVHTAEEIHLRLARGTDIPIVVEAEGVVPQEVTLHFEGGRDLFLNPSGGNVFRTLLRSCQEDVVFWATGGDDRDGLPRVVVEVLQPPDLEGVAVAVTPPAYSGLEPQLVFNRDVEVLAGSDLRVFVLPAPREANGLVRLLPQDRTLPLERAAFPLEPGLEEGAAPESGLAFDLRVEESLGFRFELVDDKGLENPDPGLFRIRVTEDRAPELSVLAPARTEFEVVQGGAIPVRVRAEDDFGLVSLGWRARKLAGVEDTPPVAAGELALVPLSAEPGSGGARARALAGTRLEVNDLGTEADPVAVDQRFAFEIFATDNREPVAGVGRALPIRARVVTPEELLRRMQDRLAQARLATVRLADLQTEKRTRVEELLESLEGDETLETGDTVVLNTVLSGQRRVLGDAQTLARDLASVTEDILYARLDDKADTLLELFDRRMREVSDLRFQAEPWRDLSRALAEGRAGTPGFASNLVELVALALEISEDHVRGAVDALAEAERAVDAAAVQGGLLIASERQTQALARIDALLDALAEWDNFQNILTLTRDILNRQRALRERTQQFASDK